VNQRIVILGGGPAGYEAALVAAELDADVTVVADEGLGGNSVLWDCVPSKALITTADTMGWLRTAESMGVHLDGAERIDRTVVDFPQVAANVLGLGVSQSNDIERRVRGAGVTLVRGRGRISAPHEVTSRSRAAASGAARRRPAGRDRVDRPRAAVLRAGRGAGARRPPGLRAPEVPEHLVVVGSGATGAEFANAFRRFGAEVTLVSSRDLILPTEDPDAAEVIEAVFERRGMTILRNARAVSCERRATRSSSGSRTARGGRLPRAVHRRAGPDLAGHRPRGVRGGDQRLGWHRRRHGGSHERRWIYAAGDVTGRVMLANVAAMQGRTAMWHALGRRCSRSGGTRSPRRSSPPRRSRPSGGRRRRPSRPASRWRPRGSTSAATRARR
jgi:NAD(P)H dehydrogenase (quinone)